MSSTSAIAAQLPVTGMTISIATSGSPDYLAVIANVTDYAQAMKSTIVMTTNVGDTFARRAPTLIDPGAPTFKIFYLPEEVTHRNSVDVGQIPAGLRYLMIKKLLRQTTLNYPADANGNTPADSYLAYVTDFGLTGKTAGVFEANITMGINDQNPSFA